MPHDLGAQSLREHQGLTGGRVRQQYRELVTALSGDQVEGPNRPLQHPSDQLQGLVTYRVSAFIVDALQVNLRTGGLVSVR